MATTVDHSSAPPERVFDVLAQPKTYEYWVVGSDRIRGWDDTWPAPGAKLHHRVGVGPLKLDDNTEVLESAPPNRLVLQARTRPLGSARIVFDLAPEGGGTRISMTEEPGDPFSRLVHNPIADRLLHGRNVETLRRLRELAERDV